jgi:hypothetical protein
MNDRQKKSQKKRHNPAYRQAFERLDAALDKNTESSFGDRIQVIRRLMFGDLPEDQKPMSTDALPK